MYFFIKKNTKIFCYIKNISYLCIRKIKMMFNLKKNSVMETNKFTEKSILSNKDLDSLLDYLNLHLPQEVTLGYNETQIHRFDGTFTQTIFIQFSGYHTAITEWDDLPSHGDAQEDFPKEPTYPQAAKPAVDCLLQEIFQQEENSYYNLESNEYRVQEALNGIHHNIYQVTVVNKHSGQTPIIFQVIQSDLGITIQLTEIEL